MKFIILTTQRSGSHLLQSYLNSHVDLQVEGEIKHNKNAAIAALKGEFDGLLGFHKSGKKHKPDRFGFRYDINYVSNYLNYLPDNSGFIAHYRQLDKEIDLSKLNIIHLVRKNIFELSLSCCINKMKPWGTKGGQYRKDTQSSFNFNKTFEIDKNEFKKHIKDSRNLIRYWTDKIEREKPNCISLDYQDIFDDQSLTREWKENEESPKMPPETAKKLCRFLNISEAVLTSELKRVNTPNYQDYISNWKSIKGFANQSIYGDSRLELENHGLRSRIMKLILSKMIHLR